MADQEQDRTEQATPYKIKEAKKRGQVQKSLEIVSLLAIASFLVVLVLWAPGMIRQQLNTDRLLLEHAGDTNFSIPQVASLFWMVVHATVHMLAPLLALLMAVAILANILQTGPVMSGFPLKPDIQRLNPVAGFKRLFSKKLLFESLKSVVKLGIFATVLYFALGGILPTLAGLMNVDPHIYPAVLLKHTVMLIFKLGVAIFIVAALDWIYSRWEYADKLKMSRREMKEEVKRREGDPHVRARIRELQREAAKRRSSIKRVPDADVLITNPTHIAIALMYDRDTMSAPHVVAKGAGALAQHMKKIAREHGVPMFENKAVARALFKDTELDRPIAGEWFPAVARMLAWAYALKGKKLTPQQTYA